MKTLSTIILALFYVAVIAQDVPFKSSNFKGKKDEFKAAVAEIKLGNDFLELGNEAVAAVTTPGKNFKKALQHYQKAQKFNPKSAELNMKIGNCIIYTNKKSEAIPYLIKAYELNKDLTPMLHFYYGMAKQLSGDFDGAVKQYKLFEEKGKNKHVAFYKKLTGKYKKECKSGKILIKTKIRAWIDNVPEVNSKEDDYSPCLTADGAQLLVNSRRKNGHSPDDVGDYDSEIYISDYGSNFKWGKLKNIGAPLNTENDEAATAFAYDGQRLLLWKADKAGKSIIYESKLDGAKWLPPARKMTMRVKKNYNNTFACYEPLDIKIHYITDKKGNDNIDFSGLMVQVENRWGEGQSISHMINTKFHEGSVYIHPDGNTVYFSSQGHNSMGGYDIFMSKRLDGQWQPPVNLGYPINTTYDDLFFASTASGKFAYIASNREGGQGGLDIYKVTFWGAEKQLMIDTEDQLLASIAKPIKDKNIAKEVEVDKKSLTVFKGNVIDHISRKPIEAKLEIVDNGLGSSIATFKSNSATGKFLLSLPSGKNYGISVRKNGYLFHSENFNLPANSDFNLVDKTIELKNIKVGSKIELRNVFFATGKADVKKESFPELNRLVQLMKDVPKLKVEIGGHTDNTGSTDLNTKLSERRATSVMKYVTGKGIATSRLTSKGYGPSQPKASNDTSDGRAQNRRTELEITGN